MPALVGIVALGVKFDLVSHVSARQSCTRVCALRLGEKRQILRSRNTGASLVVLSLVPSMTLITGPQEPSQPRIRI